jgi:hypothetical protein
VLAIGLDPACVDLSPYPGQTAELVRSHVMDQLERVRAKGYDVECGLVDPDRSAEDTVKRAFEAREFDCVMIGAGLRRSAPHLLLFEGILDLVHTSAPRAKICFNAKPADTIDAVQRWVPSP